MKYEGIVRATVNDGRSIRVYFVNDAIPESFVALFANYGRATLERITTPYVVVTCRTKALARQCDQYARKLDNWDTGETINWAQNVESVYLECDRRARKYADRPVIARRSIRAAIRTSGILDGTGVRVSYVDWSGVADVFLNSLS